MDPKTQEVNYTINILHANLKILAVCKAQTKALGKLKDEVKCNCYTSTKNPIPRGIVVTTHVKAQDQWKQLCV